MAISSPFNLMRPLRYHIVQPDAPPPLRGALYWRDTIQVGEVIPIPRSTGVEFWKVAAVDPDIDPSWAGTIHFDYAPREEWPELPADAFKDVRRARSEDIEPWLPANQG